MIKPYCLIISGPSGSGKSTTAKSLWRLLSGNSAYLSLDSIKHFVSGAKSQDYFLDLARINALSLTKNYLTYGHPVIIDKAFGSYKYVEPFVRLANEMNLGSYYFKLTASLSTLISRVENRKNIPLEEKLSNGEWPLPIGNEETATKIYEFFEKNKHSEGITIDTESRSTADVLDIIFSYLPKEVRLNS